MSILKKHYLYQLVGYPNQKSHLHNHKPVFPEMLFFMSLHLPMLLPQIFLLLIALRMSRFLPLTLTCLFLNKIFAYPKNFDMPTTHHPSNNNQSTYNKMGATSSLLEQLLIS